MTATDKKKMLKEKYLKPKTKLRKLRLSEEFTTDYVANLIGLQRRQYEQKEQGKYPFNDYEMKILAKTFDVSIEDIFLTTNITNRDKMRVRKVERT
ncbi:helix-turn-helix domain-containing protein [Staphylococcus epidermidis]|nr:helix-turn-helix domain-containing protein [Staphylococcus epidermidis]